jgi:hypothetical protein
MTGNAENIFRGVLLNGRKSEGEFSGCRCPFTGVFERKKVMSNKRHPTPQEEASARGARDGIVEARDLEYLYNFHKRQAMKAVRSFYGNAAGVPEIIATGLAECEALRKEALKAMPAPPATTKPS